MRILMIILLLILLRDCKPSFQKSFSKTISLKLKDLIGYNANPQINSGYKNNGKNETFITRVKE